MQTLFPVTQEPEAIERTSGAESLLCRTHVKSYILRRAKELRAVWHPDRVSEQAMEDLEYKVKALLDRAITRHPTKGKTFTEIG